MPKGPVLKAKGLFTHPNLLSEVPEGALVVAREVVIDREGIIQPRRGFETLTGPGNTINRLVEYQDQLLLHHSTGTLSYHNGSATVALTGSFPPPDATTAKTRFARANQNLYFTTSTGIYKLSAYNGTPVAAGPPRTMGGLSSNYAIKSSSGQTARLGTDASHPTGKVTVTTTDSHNLLVGQYVTLMSSADANFDVGTFQVVSVPSGSSFTFDNADTDPATSASELIFRRSELIGSTGILNDDGDQVAYRAVIVATDANNREIVGWASPRHTVANVSGTPGFATGVDKTPIVRVHIPSTTTSLMKIRLYRSRVVPTGGTPADEMFLVWEAPIKAADITRRYVDITDIVPDDLARATLYVSPSQQGIAQNNDVPPHAKDICAFAGGMLYANTTGLHRFVITLLGVGGSAGLQTGDIIHINNLPYTAKAANTALVEGEFIAETGGASDAVNIRNTAINLCTAINTHSAPGVTAYYASAADEAPGKIVIESTTMGGAAFSVVVAGMRGAWAPFADAVLRNFNLSRTGTTVTATVTSGSHWFQVGESVYLNGGSVDFAAGYYTVTAVTSTTMTYTDNVSGVAASGAYTFSLAPATAYSTQFSSNDAAPNRIYRSKLGQPEAVPLLNYDDVGSKEADILRVVTLRDGSAFVFKEDGLFRKSGYDAEPRLFDPTIILIAPDSAVAMGNQVYALCTQGLLAISETGSEVVSRPIEKTLQALQGQSLTNLRNLTFGVAYESEHKYFLWTIQSSSDTTPTIAYVYNAATNTWVDTVRSRNHAIVRASDDKLYAAIPSSHIIEKERKAFSYLDYSDQDGSVTINSRSGTTFTMASTAGIAAGDVLVQGSAKTRIDSVGASTIVVASASGFANGAAGTRSGIACQAQWAPQVGNDASSMKHWQEADILFGNAHIPSASISASTELSTTPEAATVDAITSIGQWVTAATGWDGTERPFNLRITIPQEKRRAARLNLKFAHQNAWAVFTIDGVYLLFNQGSQKGVR